MYMPLRVCFHIKGVSTAFLQSDPYPEGAIKYISFRDPFTRVWNYYRQSGPIYGEVSAPKRWEDTIAPWFETMGFMQRENERASLNLGPWPVTFKLPQSWSIVLVTMFITHR